MIFSKYFVPSALERQLVGKFYLASFVSELLNIVLPFQFIFLILVMQRPEWAVIPLIVEGLVVFLCEIPTGAVADRWGRKKSVILGDLLSGVAWLIVPVAIWLDGWTQLIVVSAAFALEGLGQTLVSGAEEAWVMDNLIASKKEELTDQYFARDKSISSLGGVISGTLTWILLSLVEVNIFIICALWLVAALGQFLSVYIQMLIPEHQTQEMEMEKNLDREERPKAWDQLAHQTTTAMKSIWRIRPLLAFTVVTLIVSFVTSITGDAFEISLVMKGLNPKELAPLAVLTDLLGFVAPLSIIFLSRRFGISQVLAWLLILPAAVVFWFFTQPSLFSVVMLFLFFNLVDDLWDPLADVMLQSYIPSSVRATASSIINQFSELIGLGGLAAFTLMLGDKSEALKEAIPDLVAAFQGEAVRQVHVPTSLFGLPVQDSALVLFTLIGLSAAAILWFYPWHKSARTVHVEDVLKNMTSEEVGGGESEEVVTLLKKGSATASSKRRFLNVKQGLDDKLERYNPGEQLTWWVSDDAFEMPASTIRQLHDIGPAIFEFFKVANELFYRHPWIQQRLEKRVTPHYHLLNHCQGQRESLPRMIRPDVVCDQNWTPKLVELEITIGARADTSIMAKQYHLRPEQTLVNSYGQLAKKLELEGKNLALVTAPHPYFQDLPDDAKAFASMLREQGIRNLTVLTEENLSGLRFDGRQLLLTQRFAPPQVIHVIDRFIDIYEIAELQHPGMAALLDAYVAGAIADVNTIKQFLDEKDWMSLFWLPELREEWREKLGAEKDALLRRHIPRTWIVRPDHEMVLANGERIPLLEIGDVRPEFRPFVVKESGTSTTASGAQSFHVLPQMDRDDIADLLQDIFDSGIEYVMQELVESPRIPFFAIDPETDEIVHQSDARFKMSPFYIDGKLSDIRFVASNKKYAVNDEDCVVGVVRYEKTSDEDTTRSKQLKRPSQISQSSQSSQREVSV